MSTDTTSVDSAPYVQLFQKAHQKIVLLERLDEQVVQLLAKRQELQEELKAVQAQINEELELRIRSSGEAPARLLTAIAGVGARNGGNAPAGNRFAAQAIDPIVSTAVE